MGVYLRAKFEVSSLIATGFRQAGGGEVILSLPPPTSKRTPKNPTQIRVNSLTAFCYIFYGNLDYAQRTLLWMFSNVLTFCKIDMFDISCLIALLVLRLKLGYIVTSCLLPLESE